MVAGSSITTGWKQLVGRIFLCFYTTEISTAVVKLPMSPALRFCNTMDGASMGLATELA